MGGHVSDSEGRPHHMKSHADTSKTLATCEHCLRRDHKSCNGWAVKKLVKCLCKEINNHLD